MWQKRGIMGAKTDNKNQYMLRGISAWKGYDWWWHSFTGVNTKTGEEKAFFIEYFVMNPKQGGINPIFKKEGKKGPAYVMIKAGTWGKDAKQLHRFFGTEELECDKEELRVVAGDCFLSETVLKGNVSVKPETKEQHPEYMSDAGTMSWLLQMEKQVGFDAGYGTSRLLRSINAFQMYWHAAGIKTQYSGTVFLDGERYTVSPDTSFGYADKNWGSDFTNPWLWLSSCSLYRKETGERLNNTVFDIGGGCPKIFGVPLKQNLLGLMHYEGKDYEFNFSKFWTFTQTKFRCKETEKEILWQVRMANIHGAIEIKVKCPKEDMLLVRYQSPDGEKRHDKLWNGGTGRGQVKLFRRAFGGLRLVDEMMADHVGCEWGKY